MREDLHYAKAPLDWTVANLPSFEGRLKAWVKDNISTVVRQTDSDPTHDLIVAVEKCPLPLTFSAEAGAYINAIRSSLDILASAISKRHSPLNPKDVYFPVAEDEAGWNAGKYKGAKFIARLNGTERRIFELLKPYKRGNDTLFALHHLDITRKHSRLLKINLTPSRIGLISPKVHGALDFAKTMAGDAEGETILARIIKGIPEPEIEYVPEITIWQPETGVFGPALPLLAHFVGHAQAIINLFDYP